MNTKQTFVYGFLAVLLALAFTACEQPTDSPVIPVSGDITYTVVQTGGADGTTTSTGIVFTFSKSIDNLGLTADDITVTGKATKGTLSGAGKSWTLSINVTGAGSAAVSIDKKGIQKGTKNVTVYMQGQTVPQTYTITWNLNGGTFATGSAHPTQIDGGETLAKPTPDPTKANNTFGGWYSDSALTQSYTFSSPVNTNLNLYAKWDAVQANPNLITYTVEEVGGVDFTTTSTGIKFTFSKSIDSLGLTAGDIYLSMQQQTSATLSGSGTTWTLSPITVSGAGPTMVQIFGKDDIDSTQHIVTLYKAGEYVPITEGQFTYRLINNNTEVIVSAANMSISGAIVIPATYTHLTQSLPVTTIGGFSGCTGITSIAIPASVTEISNLDFGMAFLDCTSLTAITVDASNTIYASDDGGLYNKAKTTLFLVPPGKSGTVTIPASVTEIGNAAFARCASLTAITVDASNTIYASDDGVLYNKAKTTLITFPQGKTGTITIPSSVTEIGNAAFSYCTGITSIAIPASVTEIGNAAFVSCTGLTAITVNADNPNYASDDGVLYNKAKTTLITFPGGKSGSVTIPTTVTGISDAAFIGCASLTAITIPEGVTSIGGSAFGNCTGLTSITIPESVTSIGIFAFGNWTSSQTINIKGYADEAAANEAWMWAWLMNCNAIRKYWNGTAFQ